MGNFLILVPHPLKFIKNNVSFLRPRFSICFPFKESVTSDLLLHLLLIAYVIYWSLSISSWKENQRFSDVFRGYRRRPVAWKMSSAVNMKYCTILMCFFQSINLIFGFEGNQSKNIWNVHSATSTTDTCIYISLGFLRVYGKEWLYMVC